MVFVCVWIILRPKWNQVYCPFIHIDANMLKCIQCRHIAKSTNSEIVKEEILFRIWFSMIFKNIPKQLELVLYFKKYNNQWTYWYQFFVFILSICIIASIILLASIYRWQWKQATQQMSYNTLFSWWQYDFPWFWSFYFQSSDFVWYIVYNFETIKINVIHFNVWHVKSQRKCTL